MKNSKGENMKKENNTKYTIKSLQKALDILDCFTTENPELTVGEIIRLV